MLCTRRSSHNQTAMLVCDLFFPALVQMQHGTQAADAGKRPVLPPAESHLMLPISLPVPPAVQVGRGQGPEPVGGSATQCKGAAVKHLQGNIWHLPCCCKDTNLLGSSILPLLKASGHQQWLAAVT